MPERSGLPEAVRGVGASKRTLPSALRGSLGSGTGAHCAEALAVQASAMRLVTAMRTAVAPAGRANRPARRGVVFVTVIVRSLLKAGISCRTRTKRSIEIYRGRRAA